MLLVTFYKSYEEVINILIFIIDHFVHFHQRHLQKINLGERTHQRHHVDTIRSHIQRRNVSRQVNLHRIVAEIPKPRVAIKLRDVEAKGKRFLSRLHRVQQRSQNQRNARESIAQQHHFDDDTDKKDVTHKLGFRAWTALLVVQIPRILMDPDHLFAVYHTGEHFRRNLKPNSDRNQTENQLFSTATNLVRSYETGVEINHHSNKYREQTKREDFVIFAQHIYSGHFGNSAGSHN